MGKKDLIGKSCGEEWKIWKVKIKIKNEKKKVTNEGEFGLKYIREGWL